MYGILHKVEHHACRVGPFRKVLGLQDLEQRLQGHLLLQVALSAHRLREDVSAARSTNSLSVFAVTAPKIVLLQQWRGIHGGRLVE